MLGFIYFIVIVLANTIGAVSGMGGGIIIKPVFDFIGQDSVGTISFYSTIAVFTMSIVSTRRHIKNGIVINWSEIVIISFGSIVGGIIGNFSFEKMLLISSRDENVTIIQIIITIITLIFAFLYIQFDIKSLQLTRKIWFIFSGFILGFLASFLGIGGGPINVALLMFMFSVPIKKSTVYSICIIFCSQLAKIIMIILFSSFSGYDLTILLYIIPAAIIGGNVGAQVSRLLSIQTITNIFQTTIMCVLFINIYNLIQIFY